MEALFCLADADGVIRLQASPDEICFAGMEMWASQISGVFGVLAVVVFLPLALRKQIARIIKEDRWDVPEEQEMFGNFYAGSKTSFWWWCFLQFYVEDVFLAVAEIAMMSMPTMLTIGTISTFGVYVIGVTALRPFEEPMDLYLNLGECAINIFACLLSWVAETSLEETLPIWVTGGLWLVLATQFFFVPYSAWPMWEMLKLYLEHTSNKLLTRLSKKIGSKGPVAALMMEAGLVDSARYENLVNKGGINEGVSKKLIKTRLRRSQHAMRVALFVNRFRRKMMKIVYARRERLATAAREALGITGNTSDQQLLKHFNEIDADGSGYLDHDELERAMTNLGRSQAEITTLLGGGIAQSHFDQDGDGHLDFEEFRAVMLPKEVRERRDAEKRAEENKAEEARRSEMFPDDNVRPSQFKRQTGGMPSRFFGRRTTPAHTTHSEPQGTSQDQELGDLLKEVNELKAQTAAAARAPLHRGAAGAAAGSAKRQAPNFAHMHELAYQNLPNDNRNLPDDYGNLPDDYGNLPDDSQAEQHLAQDSGYQEPKLLEMEDLLKQAGYGFAGVQRQVSATRSSDDAGMDQSIARLANQSLQHNIATERGLGGDFLLKERHDKWSSQRSPGVGATVDDLLAEVETRASLAELRDRHHGSEPILISEGLSSAPTFSDVPQPRRDGFSFLSDLELEAAQARGSRHRAQQVPVHRRDEFQFLGNLELEAAQVLGSTGRVKGATKAIGRAVERGVHSPLRVALAVNRLFGSRDMGPTTLPDDSRRKTPPSYSAQSGQEGYAHLFGQADTSSSERSHVSFIKESPYGPDTLPAPPTLGLSRGRGRLPPPWSYSRESSEYTAGRRQSHGQDASQGSQEVRSGYGSDDVIAMQRAYGQDPFQNSHTRGSGQEGYAHLVGQADTSSSERSHASFVLSLGMGQPARPLLPIVAGDMLPPDDTSTAGDDITELSSAEDAPQPPSSVLQTHAVRLPSGAARAAANSTHFLASAYSSKHRLADRILRPDNDPSRDETKFAWV